MELIKETNDDISIYLEDQEYIANTYVMRCFSIMIILYSLTFMLNLLNIFIVDKRLMLFDYIPSLVIYFIVVLIQKQISLSDKKAKYFILFSIILVFTIIGISLTYHAVLISLLPFLYATLYSSKKSYALCLFSHCLQHFCRGI